jgi:hypothetical protein
LFSAGNRGKIGEFAETIEEEEGDWTGEDDC